MALPTTPMAQIIENRSRLTGTVLGMEPHTDLPDFVRLAVRVEQVQPVAGFAELLAAQQPTTVQVLARPASIPAGLTGQRVQLTVRMAPLARLFVQDDVPVELLPLPD